MSEILQPQSETLQNQTPTPNKPPTNPSSQQDKENSSAEPNPKSDLIMIDAGQQKFNKRPAKAEPVLLEFGNSRSELGPKKVGSLQDSFNRFRKKKVETVKYRNYLHKKAKLERQDPQFKDALRKKFVEQAKKYFGVPYKRKYHDEGSELYNSPIFLDCCGLVRQIVYDLREDFGFSLGKWNQAYQFDTLPNEIPFEELKPGDLIFYSGTYYPEKNHKPQKHDMVHVEIFVGGETGRATIGARWARGVVKVFPEYAFVSKSYYDIKFWYRSIETWLDGTLKSFCREHPWTDRYDADRIDKGSIFVDNGNADNDDQESVENIEETTENDILGCRDKSKVKPKTVLVGEGNNDKLIKGYFAGKGWTVLDKVWDKNFELKWVQLTQDIDYSSLADGKQMVNHLPGLKYITQKQRLLSTMEDYYYTIEGETGYEQKLFDLMPKSYRLDNSADCLKFLNDRDEGLWVQKRFFMNRGLGVKLIYDPKSYKEDLMHRKKFTPDYSLKSKTFGTKFVEPLNFKPEWGSYPDDPVQEILDLAREHAENLFAANFVDGQTADAGELCPAKKVSVKKDKNYENILVQRFIDRPFLYNSNVADLRVFLIILSVEPLVVLFHPGYVRRASEPFVYEGEKPRRSYLTSFYSQQKHPDYKNIKESLIVSPQEFTGYIKANFLGWNAAKIDAKIWDSVKTKLRDVVNAVKGKLDKKKGMFEILGCDFMFSENLEQNWLIEINTNPSIFQSTQVLDQVIGVVVGKTLDNVLKIHELGLTGAGFSKEDLDLEGGFEVLAYENL
jgi:cell wall-associated NlpC family hydrolase